jgi:UDP-N-acetyl-2-amino-2-deoxyglucuronate dehydrogenase
MIRIGLVGAGVIANLHANALGEIPEAQMTAVFDTDLSRAERLAHEHGAKGYASLEVFLADSRIDVVAICTPSGAHRDVAIAAAKAGKHVLVEKPIEVTVDRAEEIRAACRASGVFLGGVFQTRFHSATRRLRDAVRSCAFGRISLVSAEVKWYRSQDYYDSSGWRGSWALDGGGALMNQSIHVVDLLRWLFGFPTEIHAIAGLRTHERLEVEDTLVASLQFPDGVLGTIQATTGAWPGSFKALEVCGEYGHVRLEENRFTRWEFSPDAAVPADWRVLPDNPAGTDDVVNPTEIGTAAHRKQYIDFLGVINGTGSSIVTDEDAIEAVRFVEEIYRAAGIGPSVLRR